jgi:RNA polymerase-associated protein
VDISLPERSTRPLQKYMQQIFERESFRASLTESELEMHD